MVRTIEAKFSKGVFEPLDPEPPEMVREGEEVWLTISPLPTGPGNALRETSGGWKGLIDADTLKRNIYADRLLVTRPEVRL